MLHNHDAIISQNPKTTISQRPLGRERLSCGTGSGFWTMTTSKPAKRFNARVKGSTGSKNGAKQLTASCNLNSRPTACPLPDRTYDNIPETQPRIPPPGLPSCSPQKRMHHGQNNAFHDLYICSSCKQVLRKQILLRTLWSLQSVPPLR